MIRHVALCVGVSALVAIAALGLWSQHIAEQASADRARGLALLDVPFAEAPELTDIAAGDALAALECARDRGAEVDLHRVAEARALAHLRGGDLRRAEAALRLAAQDGWTPRLHGVAATLAVALADNPLALDHARQALIGDPEDPRALLIAGDVALDRADGRSALTHFARLTRLHPEVALAHNRLGLAYELNDNARGARVAFERAIDLDATFAHAWVNRGRRDRAEGQLDAAAAAFAEATDHAPADADAWLGRGLVATERGLVEEARSALLRACELGPQRTDIQLALADVLRAEGKLDEAADAYRLALRGDLDDPTGWVKLGNVSFALGQLADAAFAHRRAIEIDPNLAAAHNGLGAALMLQDADAARAALQRAAELDSTDPHPVMNLALLAERRGDQLAAQTHWQHAQERAPEASLPQARLAQLP